MTPDMTQSRILIVDDDERLRKLLDRYLTEHGFCVTAASCAEEAAAYLDYIIFDLMILDIMMPGESGLELSKRLVQNGLKTPILLLTAMGEVDHRIQGLEAGADDYMGKPFEPKELLLRIKAILRRSVLEPPLPLHTFRVGPYFFDHDKLCLKNDHHTVSLTQVEGTLLKILVDHAGTALSRDDLAEKSGIQGNLRTIDVQITRLRRKLEQDPKTPLYLQTVRNVGYILWLN